MFRHHDKVEGESGSAIMETHSPLTHFSSRLCQPGLLSNACSGKKNRSDRAVNEAYQGIIMKHGCNDYSWLIVA